MLQFVVGHSVYALDYLTEVIFDGNGKQHEAIILITNNINSTYLGIPTQKS